MGSACLFVEHLATLVVISHYTDINIPINPNAFSYQVPSSLAPGFTLETTSFPCYLFILTEDLISFQEDPVEKCLKYRRKYGKFSGFQQNR